MAPKAPNLDRTRRPRPEPGRDQRTRQLTRTPGKVNTPHNTARRCPLNPTPVFQVEQTRAYQVNVRVVRAATCGPCAVKVRVGHELFQSVPYSLRLSWPCPTRAASRNEPQSRTSRRIYLSNGSLSICSPRNRFPCLAVFITALYASYALYIFDSGVVPDQLPWPCGD